MNRTAVRTALAAALLAALAAPALAATEASLSLGNFGVSLKDLNAGDGVTPSLSWIGYASLNTYVQDSVQTGWSQSYGWMQPDWLQSYSSSSAGLFSLSAASPQGFGQASVSGGTAGLSTLSLSSVLQAGQRNSEDAGFSQSFTLSPGSQVTFSYVVNAALAGSSAAGLWTQPSGSYDAAHSSASYSLSMSAGSVNSGMSGSGSNSWTYSTDAYENIVDGQTMQLTIRNTDSIAKTYQLYINAGIDTTEVAAVPEPASYALMGLGLAAIGAAAKRRRAKA